MSNYRRKPKTNNFTQISNDFLLNPSLSLRAKGLLCLMMSRKEGWSFNKVWIYKQSQEGRDAVDTAMKELIKFRYVVKAKLRGERSRFAPDEYAVDDIPMSDDDVFDFYESLEEQGFTVHWESVNGEPVAGKSVNGESAPSNTDSTNIELNNTDITIPERENESVKDPFSKPGQRGKGGEKRASRTWNDLPDIGNVNSITTSREALKLLSVFNEAEKEASIQPTIPNNDQIIKLNSGMVYFGTNTDKLPEYVKWVFDNWDTITSGDDFLGKHPLPPLFFFYSQHYTRIYFTKFLRGDKVTSKFDGNKIGDRVTKRQKEKGNILPDDIELDL